MSSGLKSLSNPSLSPGRRAGWRALLRMIGIGAGVAVAAVLLPVTRGEAQGGGVSVGAGDITGASSSAKKPSVKAPPPRRTKSSVRHDGVVILHQSMPKARPKGMRIQ
jgi:hypothetical protein